MVQKDPHTEILYHTSGPFPKGSAYRDLAQVPQGWSYRSQKRILMQVAEQEPDTEILHKWLIQVAHNVTRVLIKGSWNRGLAQVVLQNPDTSGPKDPHTEILRQRPCTSATTGAWYKWSKRILIQRSCYKCRANLPSLLVGVHSHTPFGVSCRDNLIWRETPIPTPWNTSSSNHIMPPRPRQAWQFASEHAQLHLQFGSCAEGDEAVRRGRETLSWGLGRLRLGQQKETKSTWTASIWKFLISFDPCFSLRTGNRPLIFRYFTIFFHNVLPLFFVNLCTLWAVWYLCGLDRIFKSNLFSKMCRSWNSSMAWQHVGLPVI